MRRLLKDAGGAVVYLFQDPLECMHSNQSLLLAGELFAWLGHW